MHGSSSIRRSRMPAASRSRVTEADENVKRETLCIRCRENPQAQGQKYCLRCHAAYMRDWRKTHPLNAAQRRKDNCRSYANVYKRRGRLKQKPCESCGSVDSQMHHEDYDRPLKVRWLCVSCHAARHEAMLDERPPNLTDYGQVLERFRKGLSGTPRIISR